MTTVLDLQSLGLVEVTTNRQLANGTRAYHDPLTNCEYLSYRSGYVRRKVLDTTNNYSTLGYQLYQLNQKLVADGCNYRILESSPSHRLAIIHRAVLNYRNYRGV